MYYITALFFRQRRVIRYEMNRFNSESNRGKEVSQASYIFVLWTVSIFD